MPNHITNQITFGSDSASLAAFQKMLRDMRMEGQPLGSIDFNKLLPMPKELNMESGTQTERGLELVQGYHDMLYKLERQKVLMSPESHAEKLRQYEGLYRKKRMADPETWALGEQAYRNLQRFGSPKGHGDDFAAMWEIIMALLRSDWFMDCAASCVWQDEDGEEDVLVQAGKVRGAS